MNTFWSIDKHFLVKNLFKVSFFILLPKTFWLKNLLIWNLQNLPCLLLLQLVNQPQEQAGHRQPTAGLAAALRDKKHNLCPSLSSKLECVLLLYLLQHSPSY